MNPKIALVVCSVLAAASPSFAQQPVTKKAADASATRPAADIVDVAVSAGSFKTLVAAVKAAGLVEALKGDGPFTVFAPTDEAFAKLGDDTIASLLEPANRDQLTNILKYHVVAGSYPAAKVVAVEKLNTLAGIELSIVASDAGVMVGGAKVLKTDIATKNGLIHVIDSVIIPPAQPTIVELAQKAGQFQTLLAAAQAAGLVGALNGEGPLTVFAPTDAAFAKLPEGTVANLLKPENKDKLAAILKFHVVAGRVDARSAVTAGSAKTLQGQTIEIGIVDGRITVEGAHVIGSDLNAKNGVVHVLDAVILPR
jgi:uncharacterized surface protein with fasciclin (FAS1) repeats